MPTETTTPESYLGQYFIARHRHMFRTGEPARIEGVGVLHGRMCFEVRYDDGIVDHSPVENEDWSGKGGIGIFYDIVKEIPHAD